MLSEAVKKVGVVLWNVTTLGRKKMADLWKATPYLTREQLFPFQISGRRLDYSINDAETNDDLFGKKTNSTKLDHTFEQIPK